MLKIIIDASVLISANFFRNTLHERIINFMNSKEDIELISPDYIRKELYRYIVKNRKREYFPRDIDERIEGILERYGVTTISNREIIPFYPNAGNLTTDPKDISYIALGLKTGYYIWTRDKKHYRNYRHTVYLPNDVDGITEEQNLIEILQKEFEEISEIMSVTEELNNPCKIEHSPFLLSPELSYKIAKYYFITRKLPESLRFLIDNYHIAVIFDKEVLLFLKSHLSKIYPINRDAKKYFEVLAEFKHYIERAPSLSLSNMLTIKDRWFRESIKHPKTTSIKKTILNAFESEIPIILVPNSLKKRYKKTGAKMNEPFESEKDQVLRIFTLQEIFDEIIKIRLKDLVFNSKHDDFFISEEEADEILGVNQMFPKFSHLNLLGYSDADILQSKKKSLKIFEIKKYGKKAPKKKKIFKALIKDLADREKRRYNSPLNINPSYILYEPFNTNSSFLESLEGLEIDKVHTFLIDTHLLTDLLKIYIEENKIPTSLLKLKAEGNSFVCAPGSLSDLYDQGHKDFIRDLLEKLLDLPQILTLKNYIKKYNKFFNSKGIRNYSDLQYWSAYIPFHLSLAKHIGADYLIIPDVLKKHYYNAELNSKNVFLEGEKYSKDSLKCISWKKFAKKFSVTHDKPGYGNKYSYEFIDFIAPELPEVFFHLLTVQDLKFYNEVRNFWIDYFNDRDTKRNLREDYIAFTNLILRFLDNESILLDSEFYAGELAKVIDLHENFGHINQYKEELQNFAENLKKLSEFSNFIDSNELFSILRKFRTLILNFFDKDLIAHLNSLMRTSVMIPMDIKQFKKIYSKTIEIMPLSEEEKKEEKLKVPSDPPKTSRTFDNKIIRTWENIFFSALGLIISLVLGVLVLPVIITTIMEQVHSDPEFLNSVSQISARYFEQHRNQIGFHVFDILIFLGYIWDLFGIIGIIIFLLNIVMYLVITNFMLRNKDRAQLFKYRFLLAIIIAPTAFYVAGILTGDLFGFFDYNSFILVTKNTVPTYDELLAFYYSIVYFSLFVQIFYYIMEFIPMLLIGNLDREKGLSHPVRAVFSSSFTPELIPEVKWEFPLMKQLFETFLFYQYKFHSREIPQVLDSFQSFLQSTRKYKKLAKDCKKHDLQKLIKEAMNSSLRYSKSLDLYYLKYLEDLPCLTKNYHRGNQESMDFLQASEILDISIPQLESFLHSLVLQNDVYHRKDVGYPLFSPFLEDDPRLVFQYYTPLLKKANNGIGPNHAVPSFLGRTLPYPSLF